MGCTAELPLMLYSSSDKPQPFTAAFTPETPLVFDVDPASGMLQPEPEHGVQGSAPLRILYTCKDIGKVLKGQLVVQTPDKQVGGVVGILVEGAGTLYTERQVLQNHHFPAWHCLWW